MRKTCGRDAAETQQQKQQVRPERPLKHCKCHVFVPLLKKVVKKRISQFGSFSPGSWDWPEPPGGKVLRTVRLPSESEDVGVAYMTV